jgi:hypothetical protein
MKKTSLFPYGNSCADNSGRRREESGRKSREGTTEVGETGLYSRNMKGEGWRVERGAVAMVGPMRLRPERT